MPYRAVDGDQHAGAAHVLPLRAYRRQLRWHVHPFGRQQPHRADQHVPARHPATGTEPGQRSEVLDVGGTTGLGDGAGDRVFGGVLDGTGETQQFGAWHARGGADVERRHPSGRHGAVLSST
ncbi:hypothetical protein [Amycolatopsis taiwanensis]|uniref:hypothetical protein n=1 Tax=Amycolatopsis taiwanensis TaxID=342230 RepID=UPI003CCBAAA3